MGWAPINEWMKRTTPFFLEVYHQFCFPSLFLNNLGSTVVMVKMKISPLVFYDWSEYIWYIYVQWHPYCVHYKICHIPYLILAIFIFYVFIQRKVICDITTHMHDIWTVNLIVGSKQSPCSWFVIFLFSEFKLYLEMLLNLLVWNLVLYFRLNMFLNLYLFCQIIFWFKWCCYK